MFLSRLFRRAQPRPDLRFVLFTRRGCHLCDDALALLQEARQRQIFGLEIKDVDDSSDWVAKYGDCVPVVLVNGKVRFRGGVNPVLLQRILDAPPFSVKK
jgi:glutaredoxin